MQSISRWSAPGLFLAVAVGTLASYDWLMSLEPDWYSTIFGLYFLAGGALTFMSVVTLVCLGFREPGSSKTPLPRSTITIWEMAVRADRVLHLHGVLAVPVDLVREPSGGNHVVPARIEGGWLRIAGDAVHPLLHSVFRAAVPAGQAQSDDDRRDGGVEHRGRVHRSVLVVMPAYYPNGPQIHWLDFATLAVTVSVCGLVFWGRFKKHKLVPVGDLRFEQSLHFENA